MAFVFFGVLGLSWVNRGSGVVRDDRDRKIAIPVDLTVLSRSWRRTMAAGSSSFAIVGLAAKPSIHHDVLRYADGQGGPLRTRRAGFGATAVRSPEAAGWRRDFGLFGALWWRTEISNARGKVTSHA